MPEEPNQDKPVMECKYILARDADRYRENGWEVTPFTHHHGANGYALASKVAD